MVKAILTSRVYLGDMVHRGEAIRGNHPPIVTEAVWRKAQRAIEAIDAAKLASVRPPVVALLKGLLVNEREQPLVHVFLRQDPHLYRYYGPRENRHGPRYRACDLERAVFDTIAVVERVVGDDPIDAADVLRRTVRRIEVTERALRVELTTGAVLPGFHGALAGSPAR